MTCDTLNPTFTNVYANVIGVRCTGCHRPGGGGVTLGMLDMSTPAAASPLTQAQVDLIRRWIEAGARSD